MKQISLDNGRTFLSAREAIGEIIEQDLWDIVVQFMDDEIREEVHAYFAPCTEEKFLEEYLARADDDLIIN